MTDETPVAPAAAVEAPWEPYWVVGILALLWNAFGATDFLLTLTMRDAWFATMGVTAEQAAFYETMPTWTLVPWFAGTWGGLLGAIGLLMRAKWAVTLFLISMAGLIVSLIYTFSMSNAVEVMGDDAYAMYPVIVAGTVFFIWYSMTMKKKGVLR